VNKRADLMILVAALIALATALFAIISTAPR
jgi:hypothetical protein